MAIAINNRTRNKNLSCPICGSNHIEDFWRNVWHASSRKVYRCMECSIIFIWPQLSETAEKKYYLQYIKHLDERGVAKHETPHHTFERRKQLSEYRIAQLNPYLGKDKALLEIGGGCGNFIHEVNQKQLAKNAVMVESCEDHLEFAIKNLKINGFSSLSDLHDRKFDVICLFHVLEHIRHPLSFIEKCKSMLSIEGVICLEVPSANDPLLGLYDCPEFKDFYFQPMHHYTYSENPLIFLAEKAGMQAQFIYYQRYSLANHLQWLSKGKPDKCIPFTKIISSDTDLKYKNELKNNKTTDTLFCVLKQV